MTGKDTPGPQKAGRAQERTDCGQRGGRQGPSFGPIHGMTSSIANRGKPSHQTESHQGQPFGKATAAAATEKNAAIDIVVVDIVVDVVVVVVGRIMRSIREGF